MTFEILTAIAVGPALFLLYHIYKKDRLEKESGKLLFKLLLFGALCSIPAILLETLGTYLISGVENDLLYILLDNFLVVALAEEGFKYLMLRLITWKKPDFNCSYDGLIYAVYVSMGFAIIENILYMLGDGAGTGLIRAFTAIPGHCFFGVFMGTAYAAAKRADYLGDAISAMKYSRLALIKAVLIHGAYDFLLSFEGGITTIAFLVLLVCLYIFGFRAVNRASQEDTYITAR